MKLGIRSFNDALTLGEPLIPGLDVVVGVFSVDLRWLTDDDFHFDIAAQSISAEDAT